MGTKIFFVFLFFLILIFLWHLTVLKSRKFYENIRDNADIEDQQELIQLCNKALDQVNANHIYWLGKWRKLKNGILRRFSSRERS